MTFLQKTGIGLFSIAILIFTLSLGLSKHTITPNNLKIDNNHHKTAILEILQNNGMIDKTFATNITFISAFKEVITQAQSNLNQKQIPEGVEEWDYKIGDWKIKEYVSNNVINSASGPVTDHPWLFFALTFGLAILGGLFYIMPKFRKLPGIDHNGVFHSSLTRGLTFSYRRAFLGLLGIGIIIYGIFYQGGDYLWPSLTVIAALVISYLVFVRDGSKGNIPQRSASPDRVAHLGIFFGIYLIAFYILLYWAPAYVSNWVAMVNPLSLALSGNPASQWFLYGLMYTLIVAVMGVRMVAKYRHNKYQLIRTGSVVFFQMAIAFLLPEILVRLNMPWYDFKNIWPLNYSFFFDYNLVQLTSSGAIGLFMLFWGIVLIIIAVPVITYFFGKRWYCSWVCGCGGLAETMGDPFRQLSDKSLRAWQYERYIVHGVLVFAVLMTALVLYSYFTGAKNIFFMNSDTVRGWYGFLIGAGFAGVVGTGFYPLMGNRVWCRFGCPLAAYLGLVQRIKSKFRITTNGGQCISCGNCSTYCEMGIDVRWYAQRGQDIVRASCVGCGVCSAVCPRGVLRLENGPDIGKRASELRAIHNSV